MSLLHNESFPALRAGRILSYYLDRVSGRGSAQAIGYLAIKQGLIVLYRSIFDVVRDFLLDEAVAGQEKVLARYLKPDLLIIDDMGMKNLPRQSGEVLFEIIMRRYETKPHRPIQTKPNQNPPTCRPGRRRKRRPRSNRKNLPVRKTALAKRNELNDYSTSQPRWP